MELSIEQQDIFINWAERYLTPIRTINYKIDTSDIRESFMSAYANGFYLDNHSVNLLLSKIGYRHDGEYSKIYLHWNISPKSPALLRWHDMISARNSGRKFFEKYE